MSYSGAAGTSGSPAHHRQFLDALIPGIIGVVGVSVLAAALKHPGAIPTWAVQVAFGCQGIYVLGTFTAAVGAVSSACGNEAADVAIMLGQVFYGAGNVVWPAVYWYALEGSLWQFFVLLAVVYTLTAGAFVLFIQAGFPPKSTAYSELPDALEAPEPAAPQARPTLADHLTMLRAFATPDAVVMLVAYSCFFGIALTTTGNMGDMVASAGGGLTITWFSWFGFGQTAGRMLCWLVKRWFPQRVQLLAAAAAGVQGGLHLAALLHFESSWLYPLLVCLAACYGVCWTTFIGAAFGEWEIAVRKGRVPGAGGGEFIAVAQSLAPGLGALIFFLVAGRLYDAEAEATPDGAVCNGQHCFRSYYVAAVAVSALAACLLVVLQIRQNARLAASVGA